MVDAFDLLDDIVKRRALLAEDGRAGEVLNGGRVLIRRAGEHHHAVDRLLVRVGEVDGFAALGGVHHAGDDGVDLTLVERVDQAVPAELDDDQLLAELIGKDARDLYVVALGVSAGDVMNRNQLCIAPP